MINDNLISMIQYVNFPMSPLFTCGLSRFNKAINYKNLNNSSSIKSLHQPSWEIGKFQSGFQPDLFNVRDILK